MSAYPARRHMRNVARAIGKRSQPAGSQLPWMWGIVTAVSSGTAIVTANGVELDEVPVPLGVTPAVGNTVLILVPAGEPVIVAVYAAT